MTFVLIAQRRNRSASSHVDGPCIDPFVEMSLGNVDELDFVVRQPVHEFDGGGPVELGHGENSAAPRPGAGCALGPADGQPERRASSLLTCGNTFIVGAREFSHLMQLPFVVVR